MLPAVQACRSSHARPAVKEESRREAPCTAETPRRATVATPAPAGGSAEDAGKQALRTGVRRVPSAPLPARAGGRRRGLLLFRVHTKGGKERGKCRLTHRAAPPALTGRNGRGGCLQSVVYSGAPAGCRGPQLPAPLVFWTVVGNDRPWQGRATAR